MKATDLSSLNNVGVLKSLLGARRVRMLSFSDSSVVMKHVSKKKTGENEDKETSWQLDTFNLTINNASDAGERLMIGIKTEREA